MKLQLPLAVTAAVISVVAAGYILQNPEVEQQRLHAAADVAVTSSAKFELEPVFNIEVERQPLAASLQGTDHGVVLSSRHDQLIVTSGLRDLFDYYLSAAGEEPLTAIKKRIESELARQLVGVGFEQARSIFADYLDYKQALVDFDQQYAARPQQSDLQRLEFLSERQKALSALQQQILGAEVAQVFFAFDHQIDEHTLAKARILNSGMTTEGKEQALINLQAELPVQAQLHQQRNDQQKQLRQIDNDQQLNAGQKFEQRAQVAGEATAQRLAELDKQRAQWQQRLGDFSQAVSSLQSAELAPDDYSEAFNKLLNQHFRPHEQLRAKALTQ